MEQPPSSWLEALGRPRRVRRLDTPEAARLLASRHDIALLRPFHGREATVSQAAGANGIDVKSMYYRVARWHRAGVLEVVREERRPGKPIKVYSTGCDWLVVPLSLTDAVDAADQADRDVGEMVRALGAAYIREHVPEPAAFHVIRGPEGQFGFPVGPDDAGAVRQAERPWAVIEAALAAGAPGEFSGGFGPLSREDAEELAGRMRALLVEAGRRMRLHRQAGTGRAYGLFMALAPFED